MQQFYFLANCRLWLLLSVLNDQGCHIFHSLFIHVALNGQWSGMPSYSFIIYSHLLIKVFNIYIWHCNGLQFQKALFFDEMEEFYLLANCRLCMLLSMVSCLDKSVYVNIWLHNGLQFWKVLFWEKMYEIYFLAICWLCMLLSGVSDQACQVYPSLFILMFR